MDKKRFWKALFVGTMLVFSVLYILPTLIPADSLPKWYPFEKRLNFGLDIKGGLELRYTVDFKKAVLENSRDLMFRTEEYLARAMREGNAGKEADEWDDGTYLKATPEELAAVKALAEFTVPNFDTVRVKTTDEKVLEILSLDALQTRLDSRYTKVDGVEGALEFRMKNEELKRLKTEVVDQTLSIIRKRIDAFGLVEPDVRVSGEADIDVQLPGVSKEQMDMVRERIGQTARLSFRIVDNKADFFADARGDLDAFKAQYPEKSEGIEFAKFGDRMQAKSPKKSNLAAFVHFLQRQGKIKDDHTVGYYFVEEREKGQVTASYYRTENLFAEARVTGEHLSRARVYFKQEGTPYVSLTFTSRGAQLFGDLTAEHVNDYLAILLDDDINSAPVIKEKIGGGEAQITLGNANPAEQLNEAQSLVTVLTHGAYKAPVHKIQDHQVGPSLGNDAIDAGVLSFIVGALLVFLFMALYYRQAGIVADLALVVNIILIIATLIGFNSALTLPGLAGIVLTLGMAVDANVLIYERIREELRAGKTPRAAIETGFEKSTWTIMDSQLTTALAGLILLNFTTGPIYGFAVTLLIGIFWSVFTALYVCKMIYGWMLDRKMIKDSVSI